MEPLSPTIRRSLPATAACPRSGAREARNDERASSASWASVSSCAARIVAYWPASREPNSSGSSAPSAIVAPAAISSGSGTERQVGVDARARRWRPGRPRARSRARRSGPAVAGPRRRGCRGRAARRAGPRRRPGRTRARAAPRRAGTSSSPARSAIRKAGAKSRVLPRRSSLDSPKPTTPRPAYCAGQPGQGPRVHRVPGAVGGDHHGHPDARRRATVWPDRVEHQVGELR